MEMTKAKKKSDKLNNKKVIELSIFIRKKKNDKIEVTRHYHSTIFF